MSLLILNPITTEAQHESTRSKFHLGLSLRPFIDKPFFKRDLLSADYGPGLSLILVQSYELSKNISVQGGLGYSYKEYFLKDYSIVFGDDIDPISGVIDYYSSYYSIDNISSQIIIPINIKYSLSKNNRGLFLIGGADLTYIFHNETNVNVLESRTNGIPINDELFYKVNDFSIAGHFELGYKWPFLSHEMNFSLFTNYYLNDHMLSLNNKSYELKKIKNFDFGLSIGFVL